MTSGYSLYGGRWPWMDIIKRSWYYQILQKQGKAIEF